MNNNRGGNNRRRGRGNNNRPQGANGGQQVNRIDSRARGNAPQMLEKFRKLANDAHLNGDRVNAEYYLQFADHYFRVIADTRVRQEEQRLRRDDRWQEGGEGAADDGDESGEFGVETDFPTFDQPPVYTRRDREDRPERNAERANNDRPQAQPGYARRDERPANDEQVARNNQPRPAALDQQTTAGPGWMDHGQDAGATGEDPGASEGTGEGVTSYEPPENPFLRENRGGRGLRPRREDRRPRRETPIAADASAEAGLVDTQPTKPQSDNRAARAISAGIDPDILPPSFTVPRDEPEPVSVDIASEEAPAPTPRRRAKRKPAVDDAGEPVQTLI